MVTGHSGESAKKVHRNEFHGYATPPCPCVALHMFGSVYSASDCLYDALSVVQPLEGSICVPEFIVTSVVMDEH